MNPAHGVFGGEMHGGGRTVKKPAETQHAVVRAAATAGADGNRRGETAAFALLPGQRRNKVFANRKWGVINRHKILRQVFVPA